MICTCDKDPRYCERHPYVFEGSNGTPRDHKEVSPNSRLTASLFERLSARQVKK